MSPKAALLVRWREGTEGRQALRKERERAAIENAKKAFADYIEQQMAECKGQTDSLAGIFGVHFIANRKRHLDQLGKHGLCEMTASRTCHLWPLPVPIAW